MKSVPNLQEIVTQIARKHGVDLSMPNAYLRLAIPQNQLVVENIGNSRISVAMYRKEWTEWKPERIVIWVNGNRWYPFETIDQLGRWLLHGEPGGNSVEFNLYNSEGQRELAEVAEYVAQQLVNGEWFEKGVRPNSSPTVYGSM